MAPRHIDLRPFVLSGLHTYVTNGGLTRVALKAGSLVVKFLPGWRQQGHLDRGYGAKLMLSRLAQNLYWHGRYLERAEDLARLINVNANLNLDLPSGLKAGWHPAGSHYPATHRCTMNCIRMMPVNGRSCDSCSLTSATMAPLKATLEYARENLRSARDLLPREVWEQMNALYLKGNDELTGNLSQAPPA